MCAPPARKSASRTPEWALTRRTSRVCSRDSTGRTILEAAQPAAQALAFRSRKQSWRRMEGRSAPPARRGADRSSASRSRPHELGKSPEKRVADSFLGNGIHEAIWVLTFGRQHIAVVLDILPHDLRVEFGVELDAP